MFSSISQFMILSGLLTFLKSTEAAPQAVTNEVGPPPVPPLFTVDGPTYPDVIQRLNATDDPQAWFPTTAAIFAYLNSTQLQSLYGSINSTNGVATVTLYLLKTSYGLLNDGDTTSTNGNDATTNGNTDQNSGNTSGDTTTQPSNQTTYYINYNEAYINGTDYMGNPKAGWPTVLRSALIQHNIPGVESYRLGKGLAKDCLKALTGQEYRADQVELVDLWSIWAEFPPTAHPYIFRTKEECNTHLTPEHDYGVLQVNNQTMTIELYDPNPEVGRKSYNWQDIVGELDIVSWQSGLTK